MNKDSRIYIAGHSGMVGSAIVRTLNSKGYKNLITISRSLLDLCNQQQVENFFQETYPEYVFLAAAKVGGIQANRSYPGNFLYENLMIQCNIIKACVENKVKRLVLLGSSCIYPRESPQPILEDCLLTGPLEPTNEGYALAKIAGLKLAQFYQQQYGLQCINPMPCNLYGTGDSFDLQNSHVLSALVRKFSDAVEENKGSVTLWGSGRARREFMHVDDLAKSLLFLMDHWFSSDIINIGWGIDISISELASLIAKKVGYYGAIVWDTSIPDGMPRKCLDISKLRALGYTPEIPLDLGIDRVIVEYRALKSKGMLI